MCDDMFSVKTTRYEETKYSNDKYFVEIYLFTIGITVLFFILGFNLWSSTSIQWFPPVVDDNLIKTVQRGVLFCLRIMLAYITYFYNITRSILVMSTKEDNNAIVSYSAASGLLLYATIIVLN